MRLLLVRTDRLGDVILTLPMLARLRRLLPDAFLAMLLRHYTGEIVRGNPSANTLVWYDEHDRPVPFWTLRRQLRELRFDAAVLVHPTLRLALLLWLSGIPVRIGSGYRYYSFLFNRRVFEHRKDAKRHELEYNLGLLRALGIESPSADEPPEFGIVVPEEAEASAMRLLPPPAGRENVRLAVVHPTSGGSAREWPLERFGRLANALIDRWHATVVVTGGAGEEAAADEVIRATGGRAISLAGKLNLKELAAVLRRASLFVSNSTGPLHLAVAVGTPVLGFYPQLTPMSARRWGPYSKASRVLVPQKPVDCRDCSGKPGERCACMESITIEQAFEAVDEILEGENKYRRRTAEHA